MHRGGGGLVAPCVRARALSGSGALCADEAPFTSPQISHHFARPSHDVAASPSSSSARQHKQASYNSIQVNLFGLAVSCRRGSDAASSGAGVEVTIDIDRAQRDSGPQPESSCIIVCLARQGWNGKDTCADEESPADGHSRSENGMDNTTNENIIPLNSRVEE